MSKNFRQGKYKGPIVKIKDRKFEFDEEKAFVKEQHMLQKKSDITSPGTNPIKREIFEENYFDKKRKTTVENKYLKSSLETNPYYMKEGELSEDHLSDRSKSEGSVRSTSKDSKQSTKMHETAKDFFERNDLQSTKVPSYSSLGTLQVRLLGSRPLACPMD
jgi:hypothetical protein